ncbi:MAG: YbfB/YjiJ family MFS transporter [Betaproteobacteria bacterium]
MTSRTPAPDATAAVPAWRIALAGMVALAVAMGIGRFAFTPLLPMMLADGSVDLANASWLASANYLGYLVGALLCTFQPLLWRRLGWTGAVRLTAMVRAGLVATTLLTLGMALDLPALWPLLRFAAGVASALVFVYVSTWSLARLAQMQLPEMGALIYTGPGAGIVASGLAASLLVHWQQSAATGWLVFGLLAAVLAIVVWPVLRASAAGPTPTTGGGMPDSAPGAVAAPRHGRNELALLALAYGLAGLGYIISATFLPVIARQSIPGSPWLDLFWPIFGLGIMIGALVASRIRSQWDMRLRLIVCYLIQGSGILVGLVWPTSAGFAWGSLLLGMPMTAITYFAMQEVRRLSPHHPASLMGLLTAVYGLGQIVGPPLAAAFLARSMTVEAGFSAALGVAAAALLLGAAMYGVMVRRYPVQSR